MNSVHFLTKYWAVGFLLMIVAGAVFGCAGHALQPLPKEAVVVPSNSTVAEELAPADIVQLPPEPEPTVEEQIRSIVDEWEGTPHRMGGVGRNGIDCSAFVQRIYRDLFGQTIPRTTYYQVRQGSPVDPRQLVPGDLVFFRPPEKVRHVGIYLGNEEFAHASFSKGVTISKLNETYWRRCYWTARRYLDEDFRE